MRNSLLGFIPKSWFSGMRTVFTIRELPLPELYNVVSIPRCKIESSTLINSLALIDFPLPRDPLVLHKQQKMKTVAIFSGVVGLVAAATSPAAQDDSSSLQLKIELSKNTIIKAVLTNNGDRDVKLLRAGSLLDENPVEKSQVFAGGELETIVHLT